MSFLCFFFVYRFISFLDLWIHIFLEHLFKLWYFFCATNRLNRKFKKSVQQTKNNNRRNHMKKISYMFNSIGALTIFYVLFLKGWGEFWRFIAYKNSYSYNKHSKVQKTYTLFEDNLYGFVFNLQCELCVYSCNCIKIYMCTHVFLPNIDITES